MKSRRDTKPRQRGVNEKRPKRRRQRGGPVHFEFALPEPTEQGSNALHGLIDWLIEGQLENMRRHFGPAGPIALLKYVEEGKIDPRVLIGILPPYPDDEVVKRDGADMASLS